MVGKSTHLQVISQQSTQNTANLPLHTYEKNQRTFLTRASTLVFANSGSFAKASIPVHIYNSLMTQTVKINAQNLQLHATHCLLR